MTDEILPRPDGASTWTLCPDFVSQVTREIRQTEGWHIDMEGAEMAMLAAERYIIAAWNQRASVQEAARIVASHLDRSPRLCGTAQIIAEKYGILYALRAIAEKAGADGGTCDE